MRCHFRIALVAPTATLSIGPAAAIDLGVGASVELEPATDPAVSVTIDDVVSVDSEPVTSDIPRVTTETASPSLPVSEGVSVDVETTTESQSSGDDSGDDSDGDDAGGDTDENAPAISGDDGEDQSGADTGALSGNGSDRPRGDDSETLAVIGTLFGSTTGVADRVDSSSGASAPKRRAIAARQAPGKCLAPNAAQLAHLLSRTQYSADMAKSWLRARVKLVPVSICPEARPGVAAAISADPNMATLQAMIADTRRIRRALARAGNDGSDVLAVDGGDGNVTVFVY